MNQNNPSKLRAGSSPSLSLTLTLSEEERHRLIRAIESAIEVSRLEHFHEWLRGPFHALLPHEIVVCMELCDGADTRQIDCLPHTLLDAAALDLICNPQHGLAARLANAYRSNKRQSCTVDADELNAYALLATDGRPLDAGLLRNAVIHRIKLISGAAYSFVLINVPADQLDRCRQLFKLLSSHLKMVLSRAIASRDPAQAVTLTQRELEIVRWMSEGKSNREISVLLGISALTLKNHVSKVYRKLNVQNRAAAVARGLPLPGGD